MLANALVFEFLRLQSKGRMFLTLFPKKEMLSALTEILTKNMKCYILSPPRYFGIYALSFCSTFCFLWSSLAESGVQWKVKKNMQLCRMKLHLWYRHSQDLCVT